MLSGFQRFLTHLEILFGSVSLLLLLGLTLGQIIARNFFDTGIPFADNVSRILLLYVTFFGAALAISYDRHIKIDVVAHWLPKKRREQLYRPIQFLGMIVCVFLATAATRFWIDEWEYSAPREHWMVILNLILPAGFGLLTLQFLVNLLTGRPRREQNV